MIQWCQAFIWTNGDFFPNMTRRNRLTWNLKYIPFQNDVKILAAKPQSFCLGYIVLVSHFDHMPWQLMMRNDDMNIPHAAW